MAQPNSQAALEQKHLGNAAYKAKMFEQAIEHYNKALELDPTNMTFLTNKAAVYFEQAKYNDCIDQCKKAIDVGRDNRADFKLIAKALSRLAAAHQKMDNLDEARTFYQKSLTEHRTPDTLSKLSDVEKILKERELKAYINPEISLQEKTKGNDFFQKGDYPSAIRHYTEAIKRNPDDAKIYSNRAACYQKLAEFLMAAKDADECISRDPKFLKGYIRKGMALLAMKKNAEATDALQSALEIDPSNEEAMDLYRKSLMSSDPEDMRRRAMSNPEVQEILQDPAMQMILQQGQADPTALREHLKNPEVAKKFQRLMEAGIVQLR